MTEVVEAALADGYAELFNKYSGSRESELASISNLQTWQFLWYPQFWDYLQEKNCFTLLAFSTTKSMQGAKPIRRKNK